jgi:hypothetical protein
VSAAAPLAAQNGCGAAAPPATAIFRERKARTIGKSNHPRATMLLKPLNGRGLFRARIGQ